MSDLEDILEQCGKVKAHAASGGPRYLTMEIQADQLEYVTTELIAAQERIAGLEESRDSWRDSAKALHVELQRARRVVEVTRRLVGHVQVGNRDAAWIAARVVDGLLADYDRVKGGGR